MSNSTKMNHFCKKETTLTAFQLKSREFEIRIKRLKEGMEAVKNSTSLKITTSSSPL